MARGCVPSARDCVAAGRGYVPFGRVCSANRIRSRLPALCRRPAAAAAGRAVPLARGWGLGLRSGPRTVAAEEGCRPAPPAGSVPFARVSPSGRGAARYAGGFMCPQCSRLGDFRRRDCPVCSRFVAPWRDAAVPSLCPICPRFAQPPRDSQRTARFDARRAAPSGGPGAKCGQTGHSCGHFLHKRGQTGHRAADGLRPAGCHRPTAPPIVAFGEEG